MLTIRLQCEYLDNNENTEYFTMRNIIVFLSLPSTVRVRWAGHVSRMGENFNTKGKESLGRRRRKDNIRA